MATTVDPAVEALQTRLAGYVGDGAGRDTSFVLVCVTEAIALVDHRIAGVEVPAVIRDRAVLEVGADLYHRRRVRNGVAGFDGPDMTPVRVTRDPMKAAEDILGAYLGPGIG